MEMFFDTLFELRARIGEQCIGSLHALEVGSLAARLDDGLLVQYSKCHRGDTVSRQLQKALFRLEILVYPIRCSILSGVFDCSQLSLSCRYRIEMRRNG